MRKFVSGLFVLFVLFIVFVSAQSFAEPLRVMSFNIRYNNPGDGENAWSHRHQQVADMIGKIHQADVAGLQEVLHGQLEDLDKDLPENYKWVGVGRDDGKIKGEFSCIFYNSDKLELLENSTFWLSEKPDEPGSVSWDSSLTRICSWAKFKEKASGKEFFHFNTHFDHRGRQARVESGKLIWKKIVSLAGDTPVILTGDFNARESSAPYAVLSGKEEFDGTKSELKDARYVSETPHEGPTSTFTNWKEHGAPETKIDYIFVHNGITVKSHAVLTDMFNGFYPSDHLPVLAVVEIE